MHRPMKHLLSSLLMFVLILSIFPSGVSAQTAGGSSIYLPLTMNAFDPSSLIPSSFSLIDQAVADGTISAETGLIYKVFSTFGDPRLPQVYQGSGAGKDGDLIMDEVASQSDTLSASTREILAPFFIPPDYPGSWYSLIHPTPALGLRPFAVTGLPYISAVSGFVRIFYEAGNSAKATGLKNALETTIWPKLIQTMRQSPIPDENNHLKIYLISLKPDSDGNLVPWGGTMGLTTFPKCANTNATIYLPAGKPLGNDTQPGLVQYLTHELMHAIQHAYMIQNCNEYTWLGEATANWSEDLVYPNANTEWIYGDAAHFMETTYRALNNTKNNHQYGAYLLPYFLSHSSIDTPDVVRRMWENSENHPNSYLAVRDAVVAEHQGDYWAKFLESLWNHAPFDTFYIPDHLTRTVTPSLGPIKLQTPEHEVTYQLWGDLPTGAARYYQFVFPDNPDSVSSVTILNGLGYRLSVEQLGSDGTSYVPEPLDNPADAQGATVLLLIKVVGQAWKAIDLSQQPTYSHCIDSQGDIEELVVVQSNADWDNPDRVMTPKDQPTALVASDLPCWKFLSPPDGKNEWTSYTGGVTRASTTTNLVFDYGLESINDPYQNLYFIYPGTSLSLESADVHWTISGTDSAGCVYDGKGDYHVGNTGASLTIMTGLLPGSPSYRGYTSPDGGFVSGQFVDYSVTCPDGNGGTKTTTNPDPAWPFLEIPLQDAPALIKAPTGTNVWSGSYTRTYSFGNYDSMSWSLVPVIK